MHFYNKLNPHNYEFKQLFWFNGNIKKGYLNILGILFYRKKPFTLSLTTRERLTVS